MFPEIAVMGITKLVADKASDSVDEISQSSKISSIDSLVTLLSFVFLASFDGSICINILYLTMEANFLM